MTWSISLLRFWNSARWRRNSSFCCSSLVTRSRSAVSSVGTGASGSFGVSVVVVFSAMLGQPLRSPGGVRLRGREQVLDLVEEALPLRRDLFLFDLRQLPQQLLLSLGQVRGGLNHDRNPQVALPGVLNGLTLSGDAQLRHSFAADLELGSGLGTRWDRHL